MSYYYVYHHTDPDTGEVLYIGAGSGQRAWMCLGGYDETKYGHRSREHSEYLNGMIGRGYLPCDWVQIVCRCLTKSDAIKKEQKMIREMKPRFNRPQGKKILKMNNEKVRRAAHLRGEGMSYQAIAEDTGVAAMTVYRALNGRTKNIEVSECL